MNLEGPSPIVLPAGHGHTQPIEFPGDVTGAAQRVLADPTNPVGLYVASVNGGVFKTSAYDTVFGFPATRVHWEATTDQLPSLSMGALAIDPLDPQHLVAGTGNHSAFGTSGAEGFVPVSHDGAATWQGHDDPVLRGQTISGVIVRGYVILVSTGRFSSPAGGLFWSTNDGGSFTSVAGTGGLPDPLGPVYDLVADPSSIDRAYAVVAGPNGGGIYLGTNLASAPSWTRVSDNDASGQLPFVLGLDTSFINNARLAVGPTGALYVVLSVRSQAAYLGLTKDQGASWTAMDLPAAPPPTYPDRYSNPLPIASITRAAGSTAIVVDTGVPHQLFDVGLTSGTLRVRISGAQNFPAVNGDWAVAPASDGMGGSSETQFSLRDRLTNIEGDGTTGAASATGGTWQPWVSPNNVNQGHIHLALAVDPTDPNIVYLGGDASPIYLVRGNSSVPSSNTLPSPQWTSLTLTASTPDTYPHVDVRHLAFAGSDRLLACSDGGVFVRTNPRDDTGDWYTLAGDMAAAEIYDIAIDPLSFAILAGAQDNGSPSQLQPSTGSPIPWQEIEFADGNDVAAVAACPPLTPAEDPDCLLAQAISYRYTSFQDDNDFERHVFDQNGNEIDQTGIPDRPWLNPALIDTDSGMPLRQVENLKGHTTMGVMDAEPRRLLIGGNAVGVWESRDLGETVTLIPVAAGGPPAFQAKGFAYGHATNPETLWVATVSGIYARLSAGGSLEHKPSFPGRAWAVVMSPAAPTIAFATTDHAIYRTDDGGTSWPVDLTGDLRDVVLGPSRGPGLLRALVYVSSSAHGDRLFVGAAEDGVPGVFMMAVDNPGVWTRVGSDLPNAPAFDLDYDAAHDTLVVGTLGRGAWSIPNASTLDRAPKALCQAVSKAADAMCQANADASEFDAGSSDPEGNALTFTTVDPETQASLPVGPFGLGSFPVTLNVGDGLGASANCATTFTVVDATPPVLTPPPDLAVVSCSDSVLVTIGQAAVNDNCATSLIPTAQVTARDGAPLDPPLAVVNGQVVLGPGTYTVTWSVLDGTNSSTANQLVSVEAGIQADLDFLVDGLAQVQNASGGFATLFNFGTGTTRLSPDSSTGGILSRAPVTIQHRADVEGNVISAGQVFLDSDATVTGTITQNAAVALPAPPVLPAFPPPSLGSFAVNIGTTQTQPPGSYSYGAVNGGTLNLEAGDYFFQGLFINSGSIVRVDPMTSIFVHDNLTYNAPLLDASGSAPQPILLGFGGTNLGMYAPFDGQLVAPAASVVFGTGSGLTFTGTFFARSIEVTPRSVLVCSPI